MANNLTEVFDTINALNSTFEIDTNEIIANAIVYSNTQSDNWIGILIYIFLGVSVFILLNKYKNEFRLNNDLALSLFALNVIIDVGFILYQYKILPTLQVLMFVFTTFVVLATFSIIKKDGESIN